MSDLHQCDLPVVSVWLWTEGETEITCPDCGAVYAPAYGSGSGDSSGWVRVRVHERRADMWHRPQPGPWPSWDWRCLVCSEPVADHPSWWARLKRRRGTR